MARGSSPESPGQRVSMIFLAYCIASLFYYVFVLSPAPSWYIILLLWRDIAYLCLLKVPLNPKQTNKQNSPATQICSRTIYGMADLWHTPVPLCVILDLVVLGQTMYTYAGENPQNWSLLWSPPWDGWPRNNPLPHICYHTKFGCSALKGVGINRENPQLPPWDRAWLTP